MAQITGVGHVSFTVMDLDRTVDFYVNVLGGELLTRTIDEGDDLGPKVLGKGKQAHCSLAIAMIKLGSLELEFIQYLDPPTQIEYHGDGSQAGSAHIAWAVNDIDSMYQDLVGKGVEFHAKPEGCYRDGVLVWKWAYFRDPEGIIVELVQRF
jgi:catechol 2,3-dioxygenase-like lactoylglutathione lyase family enzyme